VSPPRRGALRLAREGLHHRRQPLGAAPLVHLPIELATESDPPRNFRPIVGDPTPPPTLPSPSHPTHTNTEAEQHP